MYWPLLTLNFVFVQANVLTIVILSFAFLSLSLSYFLSLFYAHCFSPTSGLLMKLQFWLLSHFGIFDLIFFTKKNDFQAFFLLFTASIRSRKPGPTLVHGVFSLTSSFRSLIFTHIADTQEADFHSILFFYFYSKCLFTEGDFRVFLISSTLGRCCSLNLVYTPPPPTSHPQELLDHFQGT